MSQVSHSTDRSRARDEMRLTSEASMLALDASKWQVRLVSLRREPREAHVLFLEKKSLSRVERARQASWRASECDAHAPYRHQASLASYHTRREILPAGGPHTAHRSRMV